MSSRVPSSLLTTDELLIIANFRRECADNLDDALSDFQNDSRIVNALDYGATGDGVTDDTVALQAAIDAAGAAGGICYIPATAAAYMFSNLTLPSGVRLVGAHMRMCTLQRLPGSTGDAIREKTVAEGNASGAQAIGIEDICVAGCSNDPGDGISLGNQNPALALASQAGLRNVYVSGFVNGAGYNLNGNAVSHFYLWVDRCSVGLKEVGIANVYHSVWAEQCTLYHVQVTGTGNMFFGIQIEDDNSGTNPCIRNESYDTLFDGVFIALGIDKTTVCSNLGARAAFRNIFLLANGHTFTDLIRHSTGLGTGAVDYKIHEFIVGETDAAASYYVNGSTGNWNRLRGDTYKINGVESGGIGIGEVTISDWLLDIRKSNAVAHVLDLASGGNGTYTGGLDQVEIRNDDQTSVYNLLKVDVANIAAKTLKFSSDGKLFVGGETEIDGALNHDGATAGFYAAPPVAQAGTIATVSGGATVDAEARTAINAVLVALRNLGLIAT